MRLHRSAAVLTAWFTLWLTGCSRTGTFAIKPQFERDGQVSQGLAQFVIRPQFDGAWPFSDGLAAVSIGGKWGYIYR